MVLSAIAQGRAGFQGLSPPLAGAMAEDFGEPPGGQELCPSRVRQRHRHRQRTGCSEEDPQRRRK